MAAQQSAAQQAWRDALMACLQDTPPHLSHARRCQPTSKMSSIAEPLCASFSSLACLASCSSKHLLVEDTMPGGHRENSHPNDATSLDHRPQPECLNKAWASNACSSAHLLRRRHIAVGALQLLDPLLDAALQAAVVDWHRRRLGDALGLLNRSANHPAHIAASRRLGLQAQVTGDAIGMGEI